MGVSASPPGVLEGEGRCPLGIGKQESSPTRPLGGGARTAGLAQRAAVVPDGGAGVSTQQGPAGGVTGPRELSPLLCSPSGPGPSALLCAGPSLGLHRIPFEP